MAENGHPPMKRVEMCRELLHLQTQIEKAGTLHASRRYSAAAIARSKARALRNVLLGRASNAADELLSDATATGAMLRHLRALKDAPPAARATAALYAAGIKVSRTALDRRASFAGIELTGSPTGGTERFELDTLVSQWAKDVDPVIDDCISRGKLGEDLREGLATLAGSFEQAKAEQARVLADFDPRINAAYEQYKLMLAQSSAMPTIAERVAAREKASEFFRENVDALQEERKRLFYAAHEAAKVRAAEVGGKIVARVLESSRVSEDEALQWAKAQVITPAAKARLRKIGYPADRVVSDMAEFYRVIGGRLKRVRIDSKGDRRANASDIEAHGKVGTINLDSKFDRRVLWHELGHHMEADPVAKAAAVA